jgi:hypothetical protein
VDKEINTANEIARITKILLNKGAFIMIVLNLGLIINMFKLRIFKRVTIFRITYISTLS